MSSTRTPQTLAFSEFDFASQALPLVGHGLPVGLAARGRLPSRLLPWFHSLLRSAPCGAPVPHARPRYDEGRRAAPQVVDDFPPRARTPIARTRAVSPHRLN